MYILYFIFYILYLNKKGKSFFSALTKGSFALSRKFNLLFKMLKFLKGKFF
jgi:hypothetical protein